MLTVKIDEDDAVEMLMDRLRTMWDPTSQEEELYQKYYEDIIYSYDGSEFNPGVIVDNDYVNYLTVISEDEFGDYDIEDEEDDRILTSMTDYNDKKWYLIG